MSGPDVRGYGRAALGVFGLGALILVLINGLTDPYGIYRRRGLPHLGMPEVTWSRVAAGERVTDDCQVAFLGSSRVMYGFGPRLPRWGRRKVCSGALGGTNIREIGDLWDLMVAEGNVRVALLFLDLHMFHDGRQPNHDYVPSRLNPERSRLAYHVWSLTSLDALAFSAQQHGTPLPFVDPPTPPKGPLVANLVQIGAFMKRPDIYRWFVSMDESLAELDRILDDAEAHRIQVLLVIPPVHAMNLEALEVAGLWELNKSWKREVVRIASQRRRKLRVWDFATYHSPAMSPLPIDRTVPINPWWVDLSHQSQQLGFLTLERIQAEVSGQDGRFEDAFGTQLTPANVEASLDALDEGRVRWRAEHPEQAAWFDGLIDKLREVEPAAFDDMERARIVRGEPPRRAVSRKRQAGGEVELPSTRDPIDP